MQKCGSFLLAIVWGSLSLGTAFAQLESPWQLSCDRSQASPSMLLSHFSLRPEADGFYTARMWWRVDMRDVSPHTEVVATKLRCRTAANDPLVAYCWNNPLETNDWINSYIQVAREQRPFVDHAGREQREDTLVIRGNSPYVEATRENPYFRDVVGRFLAEYPVTVCTTK